MISHWLKYIDQEKGINEFQTFNIQWNTENHHQQVREMEQGHLQEQGVYPISLKETRQKLTRKAAKRPRARLKELYEYLTSIDYSLHVTISHPGRKAK